MDAHLLEEAFNGAAGAIPTWVNYANDTATLTGDGGATATGNAWMRHPTTVDLNTSPTFMELRTLAGEVRFMFALGTAPGTGYLACIVYSDGALAAGASWVGVPTIRGAGTPPRYLAQWIDGLDVVMAYADDGADPTDIADYTELARFTRGAGGVLAGYLAFQVQTGDVIEGFNTGGVGGDPATQLVITTEPPTSVEAGEEFTVVVEAKDAGGITDSSYTQNVTLSAPAGSFLTGTLTVTAVAGVATFTGLKLQAWPQTDVVVTADEPTTLTTTDTDPIDVTAPAGGAITLATGDLDMKPMSANGNDKERTVYFDAYGDTGAPVTSLSGVAQISINGAAAEPSDNPIESAPAGSNRYKLVLSAAELAALDNVVQVRPFGDATRIVGGIAVVIGYKPATAGQEVLLDNSNRVIISPLTLQSV